MCNYFLFHRSGKGGATAESWKWRYLQIGIRNYWSVLLIWWCKLLRISAFFFYYYYLGFQVILKSLHTDQVNQSLEDEQVSSELSHMRLQFGPFHWFLRHKSLCKSENGSCPEWLSKLLIWSGPEVRLTVSFRSLPWCCHTTKQGG